MTFRACVFCLCASPAMAAPVTQVPYDIAAHTAAGVFDFENVPILPEPGQRVTQPIHTLGAALGAALIGQTRDAQGKFATLDGVPDAPPRLNVGDPLLAVAFHAGFGSNAVFPLGPDGFEKRSGRGEGALALAFDAPIHSFALRLHLDYADPLGSRHAPGPVWLHFYGSDATLLQIVPLTPAHGVQSFGFQSTMPIAAITLTHRDPGGIAIDDIRYSLDSLVN